MSESNFKIDGKGKIVFEMDGLPENEVERLRHILHTITANGVLSVRNSYMTLHFDDKGTVASIDILRKWKAAKVTHSTPL